MTVELLDNAPAVRRVELPATALAANVPAAVAARDVSKSFIRGDSQTRVLDSVNLTVRKGQCVFLVGPSGSGKTTLLSIIGCVLTPDRGTVSICGREIQTVGNREAAILRRQHIGFVFQRLHLIRGLTALENVCVPLILNGWEEKKAAIRGRDLLAAVDLGTKSDVEPDDLSVGQCQRVAFARALAGDPELILADEPTASLDAESGQRAMELLRRLTVEAGKTAIVVTHDPRILCYADRVFHIDNGRVGENRQRTFSPGTDAKTNQP